MASYGWLTKTRPTLSSCYFEVRDTTSLTSARRRPDGTSISSRSPCEARTTTTKSEPPYTPASSGKVLVLSAGLDTISVCYTKTGSSIRCCGFSLGLLSRNPQNRVMSVHAKENETMEMMGGESKHVTTAFTDDSVVVEEEYHVMKEDDITVRATSIPEFLAKPQLVLRGTWTTSAAANDIITSFSVADKLLTTALWKSKLDGFNLFRGKACIRVQINANPFQQGRLLLHYIPVAQNMIEAGVPVATLYNADLATKTTQPGLELDTRNTSLVFKVPYVAPSHFYDRANDGYDWGTAYLSVLSPLKTGPSGDVAVDYQIFLWFEDFELAAPSFVQSMPMGKKKPGRKRKVGSMEGSLDGEKKVMPGTPIADALSGVASVAKGLGAVPMLAPIAETVSWAATLASGVASVFGWAKPPLVVAPGLMVNREEPFAATSDGVATAYQLSLSSSNTLGVNDCCSIRGEDEMSFAFLKRIASMTKSLEWSTADASGTVLYNTAITPTSIGKTTTRTIGSSTATYVTGPPITYMADGFRLYRGSINVRISLVKTIFHSGRLMVTFNPIVGMDYTYPTITIDGSTPMLREIIDIREMKEIDLILPYYSPTNYLDPIEAMGQLTVTVLSELRAPESVYGGVQILMYFRGGEDFEYQVPASSSWKGPYSVQVGDGVEDVSHVVGGDPTHEMRTDCMEQSVGECFTSIKQLISRYQRIMSSVAPTNAGAGSVWSFWPYYTNITRSLAGTGALIDNAIGGDAYCLYAPLYAFYRGSMRLRISTTGATFSEYYVNPLETVAAGGSTPLALRSKLDSGYGYNFGLGGTWAASGTNVNYNLGENQVVTTSGPAFSVPYASRYHCSLVAPQIGATVLAINPVPAKATKIEASQALQTLCFPSYTITPSYRAAGDDFQFSCFLGTVPRLFLKV
nr:MAG: capsid protein [Crogonang virus 120]